MHHKFLVLTVKMIKIGVHLRKLSQKLKPGYHFLDHPAICINGSKHVQTWLVMIKILQGSVVTQTVLGGLTIYSPVASFI